MNILEVNPYIRCAMHSEIQAPWHLNKRIILDYELLYVEEGEFLLNYNEKDFWCKKGDILLLCPNIPHSFHLEKNRLLQPHIHFDMQYDKDSENVFICFQDYEELTKTERLMIRENVFPQLQEIPFLKISEKERFLKLFFGVIDSREINSLESKSKMLRLLQMIISENEPEEFSMPSQNPGVAMRVKSYLDANYEQEIQLSDLEKQFGYSKFYLEKLFRQAYGESIISYRNEKRMQAAVRMLQEYSVSQTAQMLGFSSNYTFSRAFRTNYGVSPTQYVQKRE